ncbi:MAG: hypothetical protein KJI72_00485 [Patescibacteria group bacterium]|nr:hypothetical protein [Patescibacteria group bacterium]
MAAGDRRSSKVGFYVLGSLVRGSERSTEDLDRGAQYVPEKVVRARQAGEEVDFVTNCGPCCWYWELPNSSRIFHCERRVREDIARRNGRRRDGKVLGNAGPCPHCGNRHTNGEKVRPRIRLVILRIIKSLRRS